MGQASERKRWLAGPALTGGLAASAVILVLAHLGFEAGGFLAQGGLDALMGTEWQPSGGRFGVLPLVLATLWAALLATLVSVPIGTLAAIRIACLAGPRERLLGESALAILAGLPSIVVGLVGLAWLPDGLRFSLLGGCVTLTAMILPTYALLATASLRQLPAGLWTAGRALGLGETAVLIRIALPAVAGELVGAASLAFGRALGEATAVSLVIGNVTLGLWPGLLDPANTLTTAILKGHDGATGDYRGALYAAALVLALLILANGLVGAALRRRGSADPNDEGRS